MILYFSLEIIRILFDLMLEALSWQLSALTWGCERIKSSQSSLMTRSVFINTRRHQSRSGAAKKLKIGS